MNCHVNAAYAEKTLHQETVRPRIVSFSASVIRINERPGRAFATIRVRIALSDHAAVPPVSILVAGLSRPGHGSGLFSPRTRLATPTPNLSRLRQSSALPEPCPITFRRNCNGQGIGKRIINLSWTAVRRMIVPRSCLVNCSRRKSPRKISGRNF